MALTELIKEMEKQILNEAQRLPGKIEKRDSGLAAPRAAGEEEVSPGKRAEK